MAGKPERARFGRQLGRLLRSASPGPETPAATGDRLRDAAVVAAFFASGVAGLVYEVVWIRKASLVFGSTTYALGTVLAVFFLGLATGSELFGRLSMRIRRPLAVFCALELGVASLALLTLPGFALADELYGVVYRISDGIGATRWLARPVLISLVILPSTLLMGGTLPLLCRHFVRERGRIAGTVALLYGLNTLGATVGCLLAGFVLIPGLGEARSLVFAAGMNVVAALLAVSVRPVRGPGADPMPRQDDGIRSGPRLAIGLLFMAAGFAALGQQVVWTRFLSLVIRNTVYTYTLTLAAVLLGIVIGSLIASRGLDRARSRAGWFGGLQIGFALWVLTLLSLPPAILRPLGDSLAVIFALLLPPAILSGAAFPLAVRMAVDDPLMAGFGAGRMSAVNTLGGVLGSLAVGFLVLPALGLAFALRLTTGVSLLVGVAAWLVLARDTRLFLRAAAAAACVSLWALLPSLTGTRLPADWLTQDGVLVDHREGLEAHVAVVRREDTLVLEIDRAWQGSDGRSHQIVAAHIPALLHPQPRRVLVVGVGAGQTAERFLMHGIAVLDCVDVEPAVFDVLRAHFGGEWLSDRRVRLLRADGRNLLSHGTGRYDILSLELGQIPRHGVASFYTVEFYERARERLEPGGLVAQFVPLPYLTPPLLRSVVRSFIEVFPASVLWYNRSELLLIGSPGTLALHPDRLARLEVDATLHEDLRYSQWGGPEHWLNQPHAFLGGLLAGGAALEAFAAAGELLRDDRPWLEYASTEVNPERSRRNELDFTLAIRAHLSGFGEALGLEIADATAEAAARVRVLNLGDIAAGAELRRFRALQRSWSPRRLLPLALHALSANPESLDARLAVAQALVRLGSIDRASAELARLIGMDPYDPRAHRELAMLLHRQRRLREAIPHYRAALAARPHAGTHFNLGAALVESGSGSEAREHFEAALRLDPGLEDARRQLERIRLVEEAARPPS